MEAALLVNLVPSCCYSLTSMVLYSRTVVHRVGQPERGAAYPPSDAASWNVANPVLYILKCAYCTSCFCSSACRE